MILETIVTTRNLDGSTNVAPMGPHCQEAHPETFELRPFQTSQTFQNLKRTGQGVLHISDDVLLFTRAAIGAPVGALNFQPADQVDVEYLSDCCRYYEFETTWIDDQSHRTTMHCRVLKARRIRDFPGFNRAMNAIIEASILASRIDLIPLDEIQNRFDEFEKTVLKTGGDREKQAFELLGAFLDKASLATIDTSDSSETRQ